jgi:hypothetical protein
VQGKTYNRKPTLKNLASLIGWPVPGKKSYPRWENRTTVLSEWEIVEFTSDGERAVE